MAPPPEYDKEPKAPDKNFTTTCSDDSKILYTVVKEQQQIPDHKGTPTTATAEAENNKDVETLDDGQLRALLDEAITYKCPKDREGKSSLFKELLHEVEQDEQACEAARGLSAGRGARRGARGRRELQSNSLQDLVAAMAAEPAPRRPRNHPPAQVSARAHHGGSLPSGVDTSFLLSEEPTTGRGGYLATVRCVNPPPLAERRVSASDAHAPTDVDLLTRRSKPTFPMTYTARATLEIGSGSVCSGRAVTTTTASNQVRTSPVTAPRNPRCPRRDNPDRFDPPLETQHTTISPANDLTGQMMLMNAIGSIKHERKRIVDGGGIHVEVSCSSLRGDKDGVPRGQHNLNDTIHTQRNATSHRGSAHKHDHMNQQWVNGVRNWYESLDGMDSLLNRFMGYKSPTPKVVANSASLPSVNSGPGFNSSSFAIHEINNYVENTTTNIIHDNNTHNLRNDWLVTDKNYVEHVDFKSNTEKEDNSSTKQYTTSNEFYVDRNKDTDINLRKKYRERVGYDLVPPRPVLSSPTYFKKLTIEGVSSSLFQSNSVNKNNTNDGSTISNKKSFTVTQKHQNIVYLPTAECGFHCTSLNCNTSKFQDKDIKNLNREELPHYNFERGCDSSNLQYVDFKSIRNNIKSTISESVDSQNISSPIDIECHDNLTLENDNSKICCVELKENQNDSETVKSSSSSITNKTHKEIYTKETSTSQRVANNDIKLNCPKLGDTSNVAILDNIVSNGILKPALEAKETVWGNEIELIDIPSYKRNTEHSDDFLQHLAIQKELLKNLENDNDSTDDSLLDVEESEQSNLLSYDEIKDEGEIKIETNTTTENADTELICVKEKVNAEIKENIKEKFIIAELPNNAYVFLTLPQSFFSLSHRANNKFDTKQIESNNNVTPYISGENNIATKKSKKKSKRKRDPPEKSVNNPNVVNKTALKLLLYTNNTEKSLTTSGLSLNCNTEVDSAIPFTCITTPEVVASCNTTSSTPHSSVAVDHKPLQLGSSYHAVTSLTGSWAPSVVASPPPSAAPPATSAAPLDSADQLQQPRSVISSSFNGLPLCRPNYGSMAVTATEEYKKSLDENGNAVQAFSSPLSGSSQQKKPRRKKSSKNETVIKSHQIDGYQGNKDLNEVLRFIESNADSARGHKLGRAKHKDDSEDKGKKRSSSRKDKENKVKRASSLEELSRTKLEDLTQPADRPPRAPPAKPERRSWGDDARETFYLREPDAAELTDFQTVTKKRKQRRRADDSATDPPRLPRAPSPRPAPSDRSNDSNDDLDSVHSLPATRAPPAPHASYADIARTRHNIPDLIESCNFYAEGEERDRDRERERDPPAAAPADTDYPVLAARRNKSGAAATRAAPRKDRAEPPAPDVVADRRPPVVLLDSAARPRDMDGVTFGFDVNEQLLGAVPRRAATGAGAGAAGGASARCDLLRGTEDGVPVMAGAAALRYVPPPPAPLAPHLHHLHRIVDYVGAAWEDVVRCGGGKVRYFSE